MKGKHLIAFACFLVGAATVHSQNASRKMVWFSMIGNYQLKSNLFIQLDAAVRSTDQVEQVQTIFLKPGFGYRFRNGVSVSIGYNYQQSRVTMGSVSSLKLEDQLWQQQTFKKVIGRFQLLERVMLEERYLPNTVLNNGKIEVSGRNFVFRSRYMLKASWHLTQSKPGSLKNYLFAQQETFINLAGLENANNHRFDQFRGILGLGHHFKKVDSEAGLMFRNQLNRNGGHFNDLIFQISQFIRL